MALLSVASALSLLNAAPKVLAALPEFKALWDRIISSFDDDNSQEVLKNAYEVAMSDAENAHTQLQDIVRRHGG